MLAQQQYDVFQAIADPTRRKILRILAEEELPVTMISSHFPMSRTAITKHLKILTASNLVSMEKIGREVKCRLQPEALLELKEWLAFYEQFWDNKISMLKHLVEKDEE
ncbi:ArsR/SmtB family transcription factor [Bacillus suaedaesalsae]|uniref:Winged helix-turn-helix transcriptional regulator n=1 Tax=Bacillus suaedaesalsae TaxID=2810349 RepID=A0ABS2DH15_9BACI|nr:metalloregulator ArsR/SmtB family transcription factor [Bacillus suaedaesalsae]MBM6617768.1 winged helix-turn-helix transcriptional regulator [Bacillus suaedaesalsae]